MDHEDDRVISVTECPRCGGNHPIRCKTLNGLALKVTSTVDDPIVPNWWGICERTGDPVLLLIVQEEYGTFLDGSAYVNTIRAWF